jgi:hypothetical protein
MAAPRARSERGRRRYAPYAVIETEERLGLTVVQSDITAERRLSEGPGLAPSF